MKISLIVVGKTTESHVLEGIQEYTSRLNKLADFELKEVTQEQLPKALSKCDHIILLDEHGKTYTSKAFAEKIQGYLNRSIKHVGFVVGGAYGFTDEVQVMAQETLSLSPMTFPHQLIRLIFLEQLYRAHTILNNMPYHHE